MISYRFFTRNLNKYGEDRAIFGTDSSQIYSQNNAEHYGYIKRGSTPLSGTSSKPYPITCVRRTPKSLTHTYLSHKPPTFRLGTTGYAGSPKPLE
ncbi:hypothetical protein PIB30_089257, partial [Stylosanthes scabra]|nr:hypothetical protein [Stylosanthes scabra]